MVISNFSRNEHDDLNNYTEFINEFDQAVKQVINNPDLTYKKEVNYPKALNITLEDKYAKFYFILENITRIKILEFDMYFQPHMFQDIEAKRYYLSISINLDSINVSLN